jgi:hypothetical protein
LLEQTGEAAAALRSYRDLAALWSDADPSLRPIVERVERRITALSR